MLQMGCGVAINAIKSSRAPHSFLGIHQAEGKVAIYHTKGNLTVT